MSILEQFNLGSFYQIGAYDLPTADEAIERINQDLLPHQSKFVMTLTIENLLLSVDSVL